MMATVAAALQAFESYLDTSSGSRPLRAERGDGARGRAQFVVFNTVPTSILG